MNTDEHAMAVLERANPVPTSDVVDVPMRADRYLEEIQQRSSTVTIQPNQPPSTHRRWAMLGAAAAVVVVVVAAVALAVGGDDDSVVVDTPDSVPTTSTPSTDRTTLPTPAPPPADTLEGAQAIAASLFAAHNAGGTDDVMSLLADDARWTEDYSGLPPDPDRGEDVPLGEIEIGLAWDHAQGEIWAEPVCVPADEQPGTGVAMSCEWETRDALILAVDGASVATRALIVVSEEEIEQVHIVYAPDFTDLANPFHAWMAQHHPEVTGADCCAGGTRAESEQNGRLRAQWAAEWATWMETWECTIGEICSLEVDDWAAEYSTQCAVLAPTDPLDDLVAGMTGIPPAIGNTAVNILVAADEDLAGGGRSDEELAELQLRRLEAMVELGIDERCHPVIE